MTPKPPQKSPGHSPELASARRLLALGQQLGEALERSGPGGLARAMVAQGCRAAALFAPWGQPVGWEGSVAPARLWAAIAAGPADGVVEHGGHTWVVRRVADETSPVGTIAAGDGGKPPDLATLVVETARDALLRLATREARSRDEEAAVGAGLLDSLLQGSDPGKLTASLEAVGFEPRGSFVIGSVEIADPRVRRRTALVTELSHWRRLDAARRAALNFLAANGFPALGLARGERLVLLWNSPDPESQLGPLGESLARAALPSVVRVGVSEPRAGVGQIPAAYRDALLALGATTPGTPIVRYGRLDPVTWILSRQSADQLGALADSVLGPLRAADRTGKLARTLEVLVDCDLDAGLAADRLNVHPNTLRYRLGRLERVLGDRLASVPTLARVYLALQAARLQPR
jgi:hypothetical protein